MTGVKDITRLCFSSYLAGIVANKIEQSFYSVYSYSGIESIKHTLRVVCKVHSPLLFVHLVWIEITAIPPPFCFPKFIFPQKCFFGHFYKDEMNIPRYYFY